MTSPNDSAVGSPPNQAGPARIERLTGPNADLIIEPLLREYVAWAADKLTTDLGVRFDNPERVIEDHHALFRDELPNLIGARGRLLLARLDDQPAGLGALKPVDTTTAEI